MKNKNNRPWRVIIDTNIWISFLIGKHLAGLHRHINSGQVNSDMQNATARIS